MDRATLTFLHTFSDRARTEGEALHRNGCVRQIFGNHQAVYGRVEDAGELFRTTLRFEGDEWVGACSSDPRGRSGAVYATMLERVERGEALPGVPNVVGEQSVGDVLEERLGRRLEAPEELFIDKLEKRYRRFEVEQAVYDHDLVRLSPKWPTDSYDPLQLWEVPPRDIEEFWSYIAYAFNKRNLDYPEFLEPITKLDWVRERNEEWERQREAEGWRQRISDAIGRHPGRPQRVAEFRFIVLPTEARFQTRPGGEGNHPWAPLGGSAEYLELLAAHQAGGLVLDPASDLLWSRSIDRLRESEGGPLRLEDEDNARLLGRLFEQQALAERLVTLDEQPFARPDGPLRWMCRELAADEEAAGNYVIEMVAPDGEPVSHSLRVLPGERDIYLSDETLFHGPKNWIGSSDVEPRHVVPSDVLATEDGVAFLTGLGAPLPPALAERTVTAPLNPGFAMRLASGLTGAESEHLIVEVTARDDAGERVESLDKEGWSIVKSDRPDDGKIVYYDRAKLHPVTDALDELGATYDVGQEGFKVRVTKAFPERFASWARSLEGVVDAKMEDDLASLLKDPVRAKVKFELSEREGSIDWFDLRIVLDVEGLDLSQKELRALVAARGGYVRMNTGGWMRLEFDLDPEQLAAVERLGLDVFDLSGESHAMHVLQLADPAAKEVFDEASWSRICDRSASLKLRVTPSVPDAMQVTLRNYQVEGFHFLSYLATNRFGGLLADDMGLGKTVQALTWLVWLRGRVAEAKEKPVLVVCPKSVLDVWSGECKKFAPELRVQVLRTKEELDVDALGRDIDILVLNYAQLRVNAEPLTAINWLAVVLDEAQQIKNPDSKAARAARGVHSENRLVLTGTPIENRLLDMWSLMSFAMPGVLGDRKYFRDRFDRRKDPGAQTRLSARLRPFLLRRTKSQVAIDLPARTEEDVFCKMEGVQEEMYRAELKRIQDILLGLRSDDELRKNSFVVLQGLMRLRQICCHPGLIDPSNGDGESAKLTALFYLLDQLRDEGHKVLVFSQFVTMLDIIRARLDDEGRPYSYLTGQTKDRQGEIERFQTSKDPSVFLLSLKAGGSGLNLTAASYVVLYDPWWNPAVESQAIDRTHRIGQKNNVIAYRLLMRDSVEEKIRTLQEQKKSLVTGVLGQESFTSSLTRDDLAFLFEAGR